MCGVRVLGKALVVYDSVYVIRRRLLWLWRGGLGDAALESIRLRADMVKFDELSTCDLLVVGGPVHAGSCYEAIKTFLERLKTVKGLRGKRRLRMTPS